MRARSPLRRLVAIALAAAPAACLASPPTLCAADERTYLTALLADEGGSPAVQAQGTTQPWAASLCLTGAERTPSLALRISGPGGSSTLIRSGPKQVFYTFTAEDGPHHGRDVIWVRTGSTEYCVSTSFAQGRGVGLDIFANGRWSHRLFSGRETGLTYEMSDSSELQGKVQAMLRKSRNSSCV